MLWSNVSKTSIFNKKYFGRSESKMTARSKKKTENIVEKSHVAGKKKGRTIEKNHLLRKALLRNKRLEINW